MNVYLYSLMCYGITAIIAFTVMGLIVVTSRVVQGRGKKILPPHDQD